MPRKFSPSGAMYVGYSSRFGLFAPATVNGVELQFCSQPSFGLYTCTVCSTVCKPFHSVALVLPSTGLLQSYFGSRTGIKLPCQYAMFPSASAYTVLLD